MLAIVIIGMGLIAIIGTTLTGNAFNRQALGWVAEATASESERMDAWLYRQIGYVEAIAADFSTEADISPEALFPSLVRHAEMNDEYYSVYAGFADGSAVFNDEWVPGSDWIATERDWYHGAASSPESVYITELYADADTGNLCITLSKVFTRDDVIAGVLAIDIFTTVLSETVSQASVGEDSYAFLTDGQGNIIAHHESEYNPVIDSNEDIVYQNIALIDDGVYADLRSPGLVGGYSVKLLDVNGDFFYYTAREIPTNGWILYSAIPVNVVNEPIIQQITISVIVFVIVLCAAVLLIYFSLRKLITRPVKDVTKAANLLASGEIGVSLDGNYKGEIALLVDSFRGMEAFNRQQTEWLEHIANGDLSIEVVPRGENDRIGYAIDSMLKRLKEMFVDISDSTSQVSSTSMQIANGAQALAQSSTEQSASIQELSSSIAEIAEKTKENASKAEKAARLAETIRGSANKGSNQMDELIGAVKDISQASSNIITIIKVIDNIAFQTNILALNAAVEAARAGHHGKGFAVVAEEVRNLAAKSAEAARETSDMIKDSIEKASLGSKIADETAGSLTEIVSGINENNQLVTEIAQASEGQAYGIEQLNNGIYNVAQTISQNSATAQESAAASEEMSSQASFLSNLISQFKLSSIETKPALLTAHK